MGEEEREWTEKDWGLEGSKDSLEVNQDSLEGTQDSLGEIQDTSTRCSRWFEAMKVLFQMCHNMLMNMPERGILDKLNL